MRKIYTLAFLLLAMTASFAQTFYSENFGTPAAGNPTATAYTGYQYTTAPIAYSGTATLRTTAASTTYDGASGNGNVYFGATQVFMVEGINTSTYSTANLQLSFGQLQQSASDATSTNLVVEVSTNGTDFTALPYTRTATTGWELITITSGIPSATNLRVRFTQTSAIQYRIDDLKVSNVSATCLLTLGTATAVCDASTLSTADTYTATIPFTGGGTATYAITALTGTISGDNPSTTAAGNIIISGIPEGTDNTVSITGGTCSLTKTVIGVSCKPVNALPYYEGFDYATGTALGTSQKWHSANSGDDFITAEGNLNYTGLTSTGKSVTFAGAGKEAVTPFTTTTEGTIYSSFLINVTDMANVTVDATETYTFGFLGENSDSAYKSRIFLKKVGEQYQIGLDAFNTTTNYTTSSYNVGDTVFVIMGYDFATQTLSAWINPTISTTTTATPATLTSVLTTAATNFGGFIIRQDSDTATPTITFDELRIGTTLTSVITSTAGVKNSQIAGLKVYPNPLAGNVLNVTSNSNAAKTVAIFDVLGKQVVNTTTANGTVNTGALTAGIYLVKVTEEGKTATSKLVVQ